MVYSDLINFLMILSHGFLTVYITLLLEFREPQRIWKLRWTVLASMFLIINAFIRVYCGGDKYIPISLLTLTIPYLFAILWCSRYKGFRALFSICTCLWMSCVADGAGLLAQSLLTGNSWIRLVVRVIAYLVLYLVLRTLRPYYQQMLRLLNRGWGVLCLIPVITYLTTIYIISHVLQKAPLPGAVVICSVAMLCTCAYILMYLFFVRVQQEYELKNNRDLMSVQISALERQAEANRKAQEAMRISRHDMRHQWMTLYALVQQGDKAAALDYIGVAQSQLDETASIRWCQNPTLNAVFASYFSQAKEERIEVEAQLSIEGWLPVEAAELSMVFANALENAIRACKALPREKRKIICKCIQQPRFMLQIENPFEGEICFNSEGLPIATEEGHGIGTRSIVAFCKKHDALWNYEAKDGWFRLRISL